jgi:exopolysaccharide production protein ExoZ
MSSHATQSALVGSKRRIEIVSIQYLRALAALGVVLTHASTSLLDRNRALIPLGFGTFGVDIFFVISGFIMYSATANQTITAGQFFLRRLIRIFPLYCCATTVAFVIARVAPQSTRIFSPKLYDYLRSICFIPYFTTTGEAIGSVRGLMRPEVGQGWTLNYEMFFYVMFALCLCLPKRLRMTSLIATGILLSVLGLLFRPSGAVLQTYTDSLILEFVFGVVLGYVYMWHLKKSLISSGIMVLVGVSIVSVVCQIFFTYPLPRVISQGLPATGLVAAALWLERAGRIPRFPTLLLLGDASYSLYLLHVFVLGTLRRVWQQHFNVGLVTTHVAFILTSVVCAELVGIAVFTFAERPLTIGITAALKKRGFLRSSGKSEVGPDLSEPARIVHTA